MTRDALSIIGWLTNPATVGSPTELFDGLLERIAATGCDVLRASASLMTKHPEVFGKQLVWARGEKARAIIRSHDVMQMPMYTDSPVAYVRRERKPLRIRLDGPTESLEYEMCRQLQRDGATDYFILPLPFRSGTTSFISWATDRPEGFADRDLELFEAIVPALSLRWELESSSFVLEALLSTYLGRNAASRVLSGEFRAGTGAVIEAVIFVSDLRDFTSLVDRSPIGDALRHLDSYFGCVTEPVAAHGGEILKFIGDAVLAVFPFGDAGARDASTRALAAATDVLRRVDELNAGHAINIDLGLALHVGDVMYGNIGSKGRLDFTVIGRAVNEACRVEDMCKPLETSLLLTRAFVGACGLEDAVSLGETELRGVTAPIELFTLAR